MKWQTQVITIITAALIVVSVLYLIRKKNLKEEYSILWLLTSVVIIVVAIFAKRILQLVEFVNPESAGEILFFLIIISQLGFILLFSVKLSSAKDQNRNLAQSLSLLAGRLERLENRQLSRSGHSEPGAKGRPGGRGRTSAKKRKTPLRRHQRTD